MKIFTLEHKPVKAHGSQLIAAENYRINLSQKLVDKTAQSAIQFSFISLGQWMLLLALNTTCICFVVFVCSLIR